MVRVTAQLYLKSPLVTQHEVSFINTSEVTKRSSNRTENGLFWREFSLSCIFTDLIMHNYRSDQSALMTRCGGTDLRHQYGIFGSKSQTSFLRNATRVGSKEGRHFSKASLMSTGRFFYQLKLLITNIENN